MNRYLVALALLGPLTCLAQSRMLETQDEARQRHNADRYEQRRSSGGQAPLGGYRERLGDPAPRGTESPGYVTRPQGRESNDYGRDPGRRDDPFGQRRR